MHHIELWTSDLAASRPAFDRVLSALGWRAEQDPDWAVGEIWHHPSGAYIVLEQSPDVTGPHERTRAGLNHLALRVESRAALDVLRAQACANGWSELFADRYPHAGGPDHTALFIENSEGFELELVAD
ncbi:hypothetical protein MOPEL_134_00440 [Mobilicoccus pelagius NBRC 104925]|uniref:VOC domain-containing protein n=1 Tax=Mobilicoccus pelagius NBRC 104925 TaxID=1089455 RepID=H5UVK2_9MICO|nr:hypothetical protein MOPEL_134_00440 [Mobilicoccus pelagius NBRC 104925]